MNTLFLFVLVIGFVNSTLQGDFASADRLYRDPSPLWPYDQPQDTSSPQYSETPPKSSKLDLNTYKKLKKAERQRLARKMRRIVREELNKIKKGKAKQKKNRS